MKKINVAIDVGGTHSRLSYEILANDKIISISEIFQKRINSKRELKKFVKASLKNENNIAKCVIGFAGAVREHRQVEITNWVNNPVITLKDVISWGLPKNSTMMVNDMELAGYGLLDIEAKNEIPSTNCEAIYKPQKISQNRVRNKLIIAPGTGFGTASIIDMKPDSKEKFVLSSEIQHIQIPPLDKRHAKLIEIIHSQKANRKFINYEDFVSGKGLEDTYLAICKLEGISESGKDAAEIAELAVAGKNKFAEEALEYFYKCAGRLTQAIALNLQPYGGIYLSGVSTKLNRNFIIKGDFVEELHNCLIRKQLLEQFPVYLIIENNINLLGGLWVCRNIL